MFFDWAKIDSLELNALYASNQEGEEGTGEISGQIQEFMKETKD